MHPLLTAFVRRTWRLSGACAFVWLFAIGPAAAMLLAGVRIAPYMQIEGGVLEPVSCGVRNSLWIEHYVAALYVPRGASPHVVRDPRVPKAVAMHIVDARYLPEEIPAKWRHALQRGLRSEAMQRVQQTFRGLAKGDVVTILYLPRQGVTVRVNGEAVAHARGHAVIDSILEAWAEREPLSVKLERLTVEHPCR